MRNWRSLGRRFGVLAKSAGDQAIGLLLTLVLRTIRYFDRLWVSNAFAWVARTVGPWTGEHRIGRANLAAAFPEKSPDEIERILLGVWDNLGRVVAEFAHLDQLAVGDPHHLPYLHFDDISGGRFDQVRNDGMPALVFAAHLANWELPAIMSNAMGLDALVLYAGRMARWPTRGVDPQRQHGHAGADRHERADPAARALEDNRHVAMLVDQHYVKGVDVTSSAGAG